MTVLYGPYLIGSRYRGHPLAPPSHAHPRSHKLALAFLGLARVCPTSETCRRGGCGPRSGGCGWRQSSVVSLERSSLCLIENGPAIHVLSLPFVMESMLFTGLMARPTSLRQREHTVEYDSKVNLPHAKVNLPHAIYCMASCGAPIGRCFPYRHERLGPLPPTPPTSRVLEAARPPSSSRFLSPICRKRGGRRLRPPASEEETP